MQVSGALPAKRDERHWPRLLAETQRVNWTVIIIINLFVRLRIFFQQFPFSLTAFNSQASPFLYINSENCLKMEPQRQQMEPQTRTSRTSRYLRHCRCLSAMFTLVELKINPHFGYVTFQGNAQYHRTRDMAVHKGRVCRLLMR